MLKTIKIIISNILHSIYQPFLFALVLSIFVLFFVMYLDKYSEYGVKERVFRAVKDWKNKFCKSIKFRRFFYFIFITIMILFRTLLNRDTEINPLADVIGVWGLYTKKGEFTTQVPQNIALFIPFMFLLLLFLETTSKSCSKFFVVLWRSIYISFIFSFVIEFLQLLFHLGTWQLSDLCFNTLGGLIGGMLYWITAKVRRI